MKKITFKFLILMSFFFIGTANAQMTEGFEGGAVPAGWTQEYVSAAIDWTVETQNGNASVLPRTGTYLARFLTGAYGDVTKLVTPQQDLTTLTTPILTFYYTNVNWFGDIDELRVYYKNSAAGPWVQIGVDYTAEQTAWTEVSITLPNPTNDYYIAFEATSNWARGLTLDDVSIAEAPACLAPITLSASNITATSADLSWVDATGGSIFDYQYVVQAAGVGMPAGAGTDIDISSFPLPVTAGSLSSSTDYEFWVRANCGIDGFSTWVGPFNFTTACGIFTVPSLEDFTTYVPNCWEEADNGDLTAGPSTFGDSSWVADGFGNVGTAGAMRVNLDATGDNDWILSPLYTIPATGYELKFDASANQWASPSAPTTAWETDDFVEVLVSTGTTNWTVLYTYNDANVPSNTGSTNTIDLDAYSGQDVRFAFRGFEGATNGGADIEFIVDNFEIRMTPACIEPNTLSVSNVTATSADLSWVDGTGGSIFDYQYVVQAAGTGMPAGAGTDIDISSFPLPVNDNTLSSNTDYEFWVRANCGGSGFSTWVGPYYFTTSTLVTCGTPVNTVFCYDDNDTTTFTYTSSDGSPLRITFNAGEIEGCCDEILIYDGTNNLGTLLYQGNNGGDLTGLTFDSTSDSIYIEIDSDGSVSCGDGSYTTSWDFDVVCATCVNPAATYTVVPDCGNGQFSINVNVTSLGSATSITITDGSSPLTMIAATGIQPFGPYADGASVTIDITNEQDGSCSISSGTIVYSCPPSNDECGNPIALTVNTDYLCGVVTAGSNVSATSSSQPDDVSGTPNNDVWFSFVATQTAHRISLLNIVAVSGTSTDMGIGLYNATSGCGSLVLVGSSDPETYNVTGLTIGNSYVIRVYNWYNSTDTDNFDICVGTDPALSSNSFDSNAFLAYPNPVKDVLNLEYNSEISSVRVMNLLGQEVISRNINANSTQVDMSQLSAGAYIVNVTVGDAVKTIKVVKQ